MSIFFVGLSSDTPERARGTLARLRVDQQGILRHFWISEPRLTSSRDDEVGAEHGFSPQSVFLVQWNKEGGSEFIRDIPHILYEAFGRDKLLVFDLDRELVP